MKRTLAIFLAVLAFGTSSAAHADFEETLGTGKDWVRHMSPREKFISLLPPTLLFNEYDIHLRHSLPQYIHWMDNILVRNPQLQGEDVNNIFASTIYLFEPEHRETLKSMETNFLRGDYGGRRILAPQLSIEEVLQEISPEN